MFSLLCAWIKRLTKQSWAWWFETPACSLWCHCNVPEVLSGEYPGCQYCHCDVCDVVSCHLGSEDSGLCAPGAVELCCLLSDSQWDIYIDGLMQERSNSIANALELRLSCTNPSIWPHPVHPKNYIHVSLIALVFLVIVYRCIYSYPLWHRGNCNCSCVSEAALKI